MSIVVEEPPQEDLSVCCTGRKVEPLPGEPAPTCTESIFVPLVLFSSMSLLRAAVAWHGWVFLRNKDLGPGIYAPFCKGCALALMGREAYEADVRQCRAEASEAAIAGARRARS